MSNLEILEPRTLLAGNVTVGFPVGGVLTITGDTHGDTFNINENGGSSVTVSGTPSSGHTSINNLPLGTSVTRSGVTSINVVLPGTGNVLDTVTLTETPKVTSGIKNVAVTVTATVDLKLGVTGVVNTGTFTLTDGTSTVAGGQLSVIVSNSQFSALTIFETGCCNAYVELDSDVVLGAVAVTEGVANGDGIVLDKPPTAGDHFGSTTLIQGAGPTMAGCNGSGDFVNVDDALLKDLTIEQLLDGTSSIEVGLNSEVEVSVTSFGIFATQGNGAGDTILIVSITTSGKPINNPHGGPDSIITSQGNGAGDSVIVDSSFVFGDIESIQGNGNGDYAQFTGDSAGWTLTTGPEIIDFFGDATIIQGNGYNDVVNLNCGAIENVGVVNTFNNVFISQGSSLFTPGCTPGLGDVVTVDCTNVTSDLTIEQGEGDTTGADLGNNVVAIATNMAVTVGDSTVIYEIGANNGGNTILLGGASGGPDSGSVDFETGYLDIYTGAGGGAYVQVWNTLVDYGALGYFGDYNINGDGGGNTSSLDVFSSGSVTVNPSF
jgi:hypothetical protein